MSGFRLNYPTSFYLENYLFQIKWTSLQDLSYYSHEIDQIGSTFIIKNITRELEGFYHCFVSANFSLHSLTQTIKDIYDVDFSEEIPKKRIHKNHTNIPSSNSETSPTNPKIQNSKSANQNVFSDLLQKANVSQTQQIVFCNVTNNNSPKNMKYKEKITDFDKYEMKHTFAKLAKKVENKTDFVLSYTKGIQISVERKCQKFH